MKIFYLCDGTKPCPGRESICGSNCSYDDPDRPCKHTRDIQYAKNKRLVDISDLGCRFLPDSQGNLWEIPKS